MPPPRTFPWLAPLDGRYVGAGLAFTLLGGTAMGAANLFVAYALARPMSLTHTQAHAHTQAFGFLGMFLTGFGYGLLPRLVRRPLPYPRLARATFPLVAGGVLLHLVGLPLAAWWPGRLLVALSGVPLALGWLAFLANVWPLLGREDWRAAFAPLVRGGVVMLALAGVLAAVLGLQLGLTGARLYPFSGAQALWLLAVDGGAVTMTLGVATKMMPALLGTKLAHRPLLLAALGALGVGTLGGALLLLLGVMPYEGPFLATRGLVGAGWVLGALSFRLGPGRLPAAARDPFFPVATRFAFGLLLVAGLLALWGVVAQLRGGGLGMWADVQRHAVTIGFLSVLIVAMAVKLVPTLRGIKLARAGLRWWAFAGLAGALLLRVGVPLAASGVEGARAAAALSGVLGWLGLLAFALMLRSSFRAARAQEQVEHRSGASRPTATATPTPSVHILIRARLRLLTTKEGGRQGPIASDYRPSWNIGNLHEGQPELNDGRVFLEGRQWLHPGDEDVVLIRPLLSARWTHVRPGMRMLMQEGGRIYGEAIVLEAITVE